MVDNGTESQTVVDACHFGYIQRQSLRDGQQGYTQRTRIGRFFGGWQTVVGLMLHNEPHTDSHHSSEQHADEG